MGPSLDSSHFLELALVFGGLLALCLLGYVGMTLRAAVAFIRPFSTPVTHLPAITVLVPARNEAKNLPACLHSLADVHYPGLWEVIVVDDGSTDETRALALHFQRTHPELSMHVIPGKGEGKKAAIETGVEVSTHEWILQTDADCVVPQGWLLAMSHWMQPGVGFVSGPVELLPGPGWLDRLQAIETMGLVTLGAGSLMAGSPNMANGANMAFRKILFQRIGGFAGVSKVASGDDELLLQKILIDGSYRLEFAKSREAIVQTTPQPGWQELRKQRIRWVSKARAYLRRGTNVLQLSAWLGFLAFPWWLALAIVVPEAGWGLLGLVGLKLIGDLPLMFAGAIFFHRLPWLRWLWLLELVYVPYVLWIGVAGNLNRRYEWKDRQVT